jgi:hypothetical protein
LRRLAEDYAAEPLAARKAKAMADRRVDIVPAGDGMCHVTAFMSLEDGALIDTRLGAIARSLHGPDQSRSINQLRADAFRDILLEGGAPGAMPSGRVRMQLVVTASEATVSGASDAPGEILGYGPIDADTARNLAATVETWSRLVVGGKDGAPLSIGRIRYAPTAAMRRFLALRDATCRFPGCDKPSADTDADHTVEWQHGGTTSTDNLALLCPQHHRLKTLGLWTVRQLGPDGDPATRGRPETKDQGLGEQGQPPGTLEWTAPSGLTHRTFPRHEDPPPF